MRISLSFVTVTAIAKVFATDPSAVTSLPNALPPVLDSVSVQTQTPASVNDTSAMMDTSHSITTLKARPIKGEFHMEPVRVVQARVQSDAPILVKGRFVSSYGKGDLVNGYLSGMDTVNTASVEGALMYVQAEGINMRARSKDDRCTRKYGMKYVVFYDILFVQTNETIAQFQNTWNAPEYGPMIPMDGGRCAPLDTKNGKDVLPVECYQFNGELEQPNLGPFIGGGLKDDDVRAPYPDTYWFSFPNTCPTIRWKEKTYDSACRKSSRKGLCDLDKAPDGVECTFAYDVLGWVPLDDLVGITSTMNTQTNQLFNNFSEWCSVDEANVEFAAEPDGTMKAGLTFWKDPLDKAANKDRADALIQLYGEIINGNFVSRQIDPKDVQYFKPLTPPNMLETQNPKCFKSVASCNSDNGCKRHGYSQICTPCKSSEKCPTDSTFKFPTLSKAPTSLSDDETTSGALLDGLSPVGGKDRTSAPKRKSAAALAVHSVLTLLIMRVIALMVV